MSSLPEGLLSNTATELAIGHWAEGDEYLLGQVSEAWSTAAKDSRDLADHIDTLSRSTSSNLDSAAGSKLAEASTALADGMRQLASTCESLGAQVTDGQREVQLCHHIVTLTAITLAAQLAVDLALSLSGVGAVKAIAEQQAARRTMQAAWRALVEKLAGDGAAAAAARRAMILGGGQGLVVDGGAQLWQVLADHTRTVGQIDWNSIAKSTTLGVGGGWAGYKAGGRASQWAADRLGANRLARRVRLPGTSLLFAPAQLQANLLGLGAGGVAGGALGGAGAYGWERFINGASGVSLWETVKSGAATGAASAVLGAGSVFVHAARPSPPQPGSTSTHGQDLRTRLTELSTEALDSPAFHRFVAENDLSPADPAFENNDHVHAVHEINRVIARDVGPEFDTGRSEQSLGMRHEDAETSPLRDHDEPAPPTRDSPTDHSADASERTRAELYNTLNAAEYHGITDPRAAETPVEVLGRQRRAALEAWTDALPRLRGELAADPDFPGHRELLARIEEYERSNSDYSVRRNEVQNDLISDVRLGMHIPDPSYTPADAQIVRNILLEAQRGTVTADEFFRALQHVTAQREYRHLNFQIGGAKWAAERTADAKKLLTESLGRYLENNPAFTRIDFSTQRPTLHPAHQAHTAAALETAAAHNPAELGRRITRTMSDAGLAYGSIAGPRLIHPPPDAAETGNVPRFHAHADHAIESLVERIRQSGVSTWSPDPYHSSISDAYTLSRVLARLELESFGPVRALDGDYLESVLLSNPRQIIIASAPSLDGGPWHPDDVVGYCEYEVGHQDHGYVVPPDEGYVSGICVASACRGLGISRKLIEQTFWKLFVDHDMSRVVMTMRPNNTEMRSLVESMGLRISRRLDGDIYGDGQPRVEMALTPESWIAYLRSRNRPLPPGAWPGKPDEQP
ncbi:GNAT family N-acetyltransferase [Nocardia wallacei]|uniref:GNAT family N-acetyltransferase n=1 Tax=Nocardia wallacei TaxID=480035 RepID=UPI00245848ED|nr:N-acetyltransferase [Nocardia wallacei]